MKLDCRNLECPEPIIKTRDALNSLKIGQSLEILVNSLPPRENISRFLTTNSYEFELNEDGSEVKFSLTKTHELKDSSVEAYSCGIPSYASKVVYLNEDSAGSGEVGRSLLSKFLGAIPNLSNKPTKIICVNNAVFMTTDRSHPCFSVLKDLESRGVEILTCGSCLEAYKLVDKLSIGKMTNAYEVMEILSGYEVIKL